MREANQSYPSIDKPWLKYYDSNKISALRPLSTSVYDELFRTASRYPKNVAIEYLGVKITYCDLLDRIDIAARAFRSLGISERSDVPLITANTPENVIAFYALNKLGAVARMVDLTLKGPDLTDKIKESGSGVVVATDLFLDSLETAQTELELEHVIVTSPVDSMSTFKRFAYRITKRSPQLFDRCMSWDSFMKRGMKASANSVSHDVRSAFDRPACILYTSGTTGKSKGVVLTNGNLTSMVQEYATCGLRFTAGDRMFNENPPFISYSIVLGINLPLLLGMCIVMFPSYEPNHFAERVFKAKSQHILACPADWANFFSDSKTKNRDYSFMNTLASGGIAFDAKTKEALNCLLRSLGCTNPIVEGYGMTEGSSAMCTSVPNYNIAGTVGIPLPLTNACIWDPENAEELGYGEIGEICFSGPTVMQGYFNDDASTRNILCIHPDGQKWLHTGDLGLIRKDGGMEVVGRIKRMIIRYDGFKISPFTIEAVIRKCPGINDVCVVASDDIFHGFGSVPVAFIVFESGINTEIVTDAVRATCETSLPKRNIPALYIPIEDLPLTKVGKIDYRYLECIANEHNNDGWILNEFDDIPYVGSSINGLIVS